ncbi:HemK family protein methyltransferase [Streptomyces chartreusis]|uniref:HemK family protein methyltransferase n=1 Tax=Streptomyces chartreusis TaxID=1969 RepID=UPI0036578989
MALPSRPQVSAKDDECAGGETSGASESRPTAVRTSYEDSILEIWRDVLGRSDIDVSDDFLTLGDHSLAPTVVARIRKTLGVDIPVMDFFESRTVTALAAAVAARSAARPTSGRRTVTRRPPDAEPLLSFDQQRLWMENQLLPGVIYNVHMRRRLVGLIDVEAFEASIRAILARHEALRSRFPTVDGRPVQVVDEPDDSWSIRFEDLTEVDGDRDAVALRLLDEESTVPFDLAEGPLLRCLLIRMSETEHLLGVTMHHIVSDTWSIGLFVRELSALYQSGGDVTLADLPELPVQYRDYAVWQRGRLVGEALERQVGHWRRHLADAPPVLALPTSQRRTTTQRAEADRIEFVLAAQETAALHDLCRAHGVTPFMALLAGLTTVFSRWAGQSDVVIGVPLAGRTDSGTDNMIGFFVNVLPFRIDLSGGPTFAELLGRVRKVALEGYDHADAPLDALVEDLQVARDPRRTPLFEVVLNVVGSPEAEQVKGLTVEPMDTPSLFSRFDLSVTAQESDRSLRLQLDFAADRCDASMVRVLVDHLHTLLREATQDPTRSILDYSFRTAEEAAADEENASADRRAPAPHLDVDRHAVLADRTAVIDARGRWSYRWLSAAADRVHRVLAQRGVRHGDRVGIVRQPAAGFVAAILGCLKAGAAFTVVEGIPPVSDYAAVLHATGTEDPADGTIDLLGLLPEQGDQVPAPPQDAAAVAGPDWATERFGLGADDRFAVLSGAPGHLMSALCSAFHAGGAFVVPDCSFTGGIETFTTWLRTHAISVAYVSPSILRALAAQATIPQLPALKSVFVANAGAFTPHDVGALRSMSATSRCVGLYRVDPHGRPLAAYEVPHDWELDTAPLRVPLGVELPGAPARVVRPSGQPAAVGEVGEIRYGPLGTGDVGRRWPDGSLEFVSRVGASPAFDPLETESTLRDIPGVRDAVVTEEAGEDGRTTLLGHVVGSDPQLDTAWIHNYLRARLPGYLVPEHLFVLDELPRTPWGEYDLKVLPDSSEDSGTTQDYVAPRTPMEGRLSELIEELLGLDRVGIYDSFFELGGFSLLATQLTTRIRAMFGVELALRDVFESPTVDELAQLIVRTQGELSGSDDLEALLDEIDLSEPEEEWQDGVAEPATIAAPEPAEGSGGADAPGLYERMVARLRESGIFSADKPDETPQTTAAALWYAAAGTPRSVGGASLPLPALSTGQQAVLDGLVTRRVDGEPLAYLTGRGSFMGLEFRTERGALIPRRETELLGGAALGLAGEIADAGSSVRILDLCTGAGNLAVSLAVREPRARVWASDLEAEAVAVAGRNAEFHSVTDRVTLARGDLFGALERLSPPPGPFDLIVCNPPYMPSDKARSLPVEVGGFEPTAAFDGGDIGLSILYRLIAEAPRYLVPGGWVCFELGAGMGRVIEKRLAGHGTYGETRLVTDRDGITRAILARRLS